LAVIAHSFLRFQRRDMSNSILVLGVVQLLLLQLLVMVSGSQAFAEQYNEEAGNDVRRSGDVNVKADSEIYRKKFNCGRWTVFKTYPDPRNCHDYFICSFGSVTTLT